MKEELDLVESEEVNRAQRNACRCIMLACCPLALGLKHKTQYEVQCDFARPVS